MAKNIYPFKPILGLLLLCSVLLAGCAATEIETVSTADDCPVTEPRWAKPPEDSAVLNSPAFGNYFVNEDETIWASAGWAMPSETNTLSASDQGIKVGWYRPAGAKLEITGSRLDGATAPFKASILCCYPTRFQATGLVFPAEGCWEVTARADESELSFVVWVEP